LFDHVTLLRKVEPAIWLYKIWRKKGMIIHSNCYIARVINFIFIEKISNDTIYLIIL
jgi:hypothetical protein